ncbi:MAG: hypothetical protein JO317_08880 [Verrucomicrobiae bacterium]|nr:hypothetical protein [Verrucomicrobiae bacterium]
MRLASFFLTFALASTAGAQSLTTESLKPEAQREARYQSALSDVDLLARVLFERKRYAEAAEFLALVDAQSESPATAELLCDAWEGAGQPLKALPIIEREQKRNPLDARWPNRLLKTLEAAQRYDEVLQLREQRAQRDPADLENALALTQLERRLGRTSDAERRETQLSMTARDRLILFQQAMTAPPGPDAEEKNRAGLQALRLQWSLGWMEDFEQYAPDFALREGDPQALDEVLARLRERRPNGYAQSAFAGQNAVGLWIAGKQDEAAALLESKFPARLYPGADLLLKRYYQERKLPERYAARFGEAMPNP